VILAAGLSTRYGSPKQLAPVGPSGEALLDYGIHDARRAGFGDVVFVIRREQEESFREHASRLLADAVPVHYAFQRIDEPASARPAAPGRTKPWGTAHAVLAAAPQVQVPFAVMNADDFYGTTAFTLLADFLRARAEPDGLRLALVGYRLRDTLSAAGGVSRGICRVDDRGRLLSVTEVRGIRDGAAGITGTAESGDTHHLSGDDIASMNLWGCPPAAFPLLERQFLRFLEGAAADPAAEFLIANAVSDELAQGTLSVQVLRSPDAWIGMTFPEDRDRVAARLAHLVAQGRYPDDLSAWFRGHGGTR
jgi:hypothetical protein